MSDDMATMGQLVGVQYMKMTGRLRLLIEIEPEFATEALNRLGGFPRPHESRMVAVAVMKNEREEGQ